MNTHDLKARAQSLLFAFECGADPKTLHAKVQDMIRDLGGQVEAKNLSTGSAALYLVVLLFSHMDSQQAH